MLTIIIPSRNEPYLHKTIKDILIKASGQVEIIAVLDGYWEKAELIVQDKRVNYLHLTEAKGMRNAINMAVELAKGDYILKCDAHVMFAKGFDTQLIKDHKPTWVVVPRRFALDPEKWEIENRNDKKYPVDYMYLDRDLHGVIWQEKNDITDSLPKIDELMSSQGSCWFMEKKYYKQLGLLDEEQYGIFWNEFQEIGLKCWLYNGKVMVNKNTWYAHWHKTESRGYHLSGEDHKKALAMIELWKKDLAWVKQQRHPLSWLVDRFSPVPTWDKEFVDKTLIHDETLFWRKWLQAPRGAKHMVKRPFTPEIMEMLNGKTQGQIADVGSGPVSCIGHYLPGGNVLYVPSDLLAEEYAELYKYHGLVPPVAPTKQDMTKMTYSDNLFDIVYCRNAMDHCKDAKAALREMYRICKPGGWIYLWHFENVGKMMGYRGMHGWNIEYEKGQSVRFWNKMNSFYLETILPLKVWSCKIEPLKHPVVVVRIQK